MLTITTPASAASACARLGTGALLPWTDPATPRDRVAKKAAARGTAAAPVVSVLRPRTSGEAFFFAGTSAHAAQLAVSVTQQPTSQKYAHTMTRIAALGGGAWGPHPARDPV